MFSYKIFQRIFNHSCLIWLILLLVVALMSLSSLVFYGRSRGGGLFFSVVGGGSWCGGCSVRSHLCCSRRQFGGLWVFVFQGRRVVYVRGQLVLHRRWEVCFRGSSVVVFIFMFMLCSCLEIGWFQIDPYTSYEPYLFFTDDHFSSFFCNLISHLYASSMGCARDE